MNRKHHTFSGSERDSSSGSAARRVRILALASLLAVAPMVTGFPQVSSAQAHPVTSHVRQVRFVSSSVASMRAARDATRSAESTPGTPDPVSTARSGAQIPVQDVAGAVTVVGVTWPKGSVSAKDQFQIRTLTGATWSQWQELGVEDGGPDATEAAAAAKVATGGTSPYVVTSGSKYQVRSLTATPAALTAATVQVVDPGTSSADGVQSPDGAPGAAAAATAKPSIYTRAQWGANESLRRGTPEYGRISLGFVHHTVSSNTYAASEVPAMIRGIYAYHVQGEGWNDIGYNFLIDRFGRTWEGRYGGMDRAVVGAQTLNYNAVSMGVAAIGNFQIGAVPQVMTNAFKRIFAWKFSLSRIPATGSVPSPLPPSWSKAKYFQRISGHRDGFQTECPGQYLYAKLPEIRAGAAAIIAAAPVPARAPAPKPVKPAAGSWATTRYTAYKRVVLRQGSHGSSVSLLQHALRLTADGRFGAGTRVAVMSFQARQRLSPNGIVGLRVWNRLEGRDYPLVAYRSLTLRLGSRGPAVVAVQRALKLTADGVFGPVTAATVGVVQSRAKLTRTGVVSGWTWVALENWMRR